MVLWSDLDFLYDKNFFILFPWQKYNNIFKCHTRSEIAMKIILIPLFMIIIFLDVFRVIIWNIMLRPLHWFRATRKFFADYLMDLGDNPIQLVIALITYPLLGIWYIFDSFLQFFIIIPIILFSLFLNLIEQSAYYMYTYNQQKNDVIEKRKKIFSANDATKTFTKFSISVIGGKTYTTVFNMHEVESIAKYVPVVGILSNK
jgi:hypothetical protein